MRPLTHYIAKPMLPVGCTPFLQFAMDELATLTDAIGTELEVVIGSEHLGWQIREWFGSRWKGLHLTHVSTPAPEGTGKRLGVIHQQLRFDDDTLVWLGDTFFNADTFRRMIVADGDAVLGITQHGPYHADHGHVWIETDYEPTQYPGGQHVWKCWGGHSDWADAGIYRLSPDLLDRIARGGGPNCQATGEHRILPTVQDAMGEATVRGVDIGEWIHLGDEPTPEENYLNVQGALLQ